MRYWLGLYLDCLRWELRTYGPIALCGMLTGCLLVLLLQWLGWA